MPRGALGISLVIQPILYTPLWVDFCKRSIGSNVLFAQGIPFPAWEVPHCSRWQIGLSGTGKQPQRVRFELSSVCVLELRSCLFFGRTWRGMQPAFLQQWHPTAPCFSLSWQLLGSCRHPRSGSLGCCPTMCWLSCPVGRVQRFSWVLQTHAVVWFDDVLIDALKSSFALFPRLRSKRSFAAFPPSSNPLLPGGMFLWFFTVFISPDLPLRRNSMPVQASLSSVLSTIIYFDIVVNMFVV